MMQVAFSSLPCRSAAVFAFNTFTRCACFIGIDECNNESIHGGFLGVLLNNLESILGIVLTYVVSEVFVLSFSSKL